MTSISSNIYNVVSSVSQHSKPYALYAAVPPIFVARACHAIGLSVLENATFSGIFIPCVFIATCLFASKGESRGDALRKNASAVCLLSVAFLTEPSLSILGPVTTGALYWGPRVLLALTSYSILRDVTPKTRKVENFTPPPNYTPPTQSKEFAYQASCN